MPERLIKVWVDGLPSDIVDVQAYVTAALETFGTFLPADDRMAHGIVVKRVTIGDNTFINPDWSGKE
jgi:hypothetical protein